MSVPTFEVMSETDFAMMVSNIRQGNSNIVCNYISTKRLWNGGYVLLCEALEHKQNEIAKLLISKGANVNNQIQEPTNTPLHIAVMNCDIEMVGTLIDRHADVNAKNADGCTALHYATETEMLNMALLLLRHGANVNVRDNLNRTPLEFAIINGSEDTVRAFMQYGAEYTAENSRGSTMLHIAVENGHANIVKLLLIKGININVEVENDDSPIYIAINNKHTDIVKDLLERGASVDSVSPSWRRYTPLHMACENGLNEIAELLLRKGADVNAVAQHKITPIFLAVVSGNCEMTKLLLNHGANVDTEDEDRNTMLCLAIKRGNALMVNEILSFSPDINNQGNKKSLRLALYQNVYYTVVCLLDYGFTVEPEDASDPELLRAAIKNGHLTIVKDLLRYGAKMDGITRRLDTVVRDGNKEMIKLFLEHGYDINAADIYGNTVLHYTVLILDDDVRRASRRKRDFNFSKADFAKFLLDEGAAVNAMSDIGVTVLHLAVQNGWKDLVELLLDRGADVNFTTESSVKGVRFREKERNPLLNELIKAKAKYDRKLTPLHLAILNADEDMVRILLVRGADVNLKNKFGATPLHLAVQRRLQSVTRLLIERGADVNAKYKRELTPLHLAVQCGHKSITEILLAHGADVDMCTEPNSTTPLHFAAETGNEELYNLLVKRGANVHAKSINGLTVLHAAALTNHVCIIENYLDLDNVDINAKDDDGNTALHWASKRGRIEAVLVLTENDADPNIVNRYGEKPFHVVVEPDFGPGWGRARRIWRTHADDYPDVEDGFVDYGYEFIYDRFYNYRGFQQYPNYLGSYERPDPRSVFSRLQQHLVKMEIVTLNRQGKKVSVVKGSFDEKCINEIDAMKSTLIDNTNVRFYDILTKPVRQVAGYARNGDVIRGLDPRNYKIKFPIYGDVIKGRFDRALVRKELIDKTIRFQNYISGTYAFPVACIDKLFNYFNNRDLKVLREV